MLNLDAERQALEPWWFIVHPAVDAESEEDCRPEVRIQFNPIGRIALRAARRAASEVYIGADVPADENAPLPAELIEAAGDVLSESLLVSGIVAWEGVGSADGTPAPVTPDNVRLFLADPIRFAKLDDAYVRPFILREMEKNGLSPSPTGISAGAGNTAGTSAKPTATAGARPPRKKAAKRARTRATKRAPKQALALGK